MNCKNIKKYITLLADEEIDDFNREAVLKHIEGCPSCYSEYRRIVSMKQLLTNDSYLNNLKSKNVTMDVIDIMKDEVIDSRQKDYNPKLRLEWMFMKKILVSVCMTVILTPCLFIPFNGKSLAKAIENFVKSINIGYFITMSDGTNAKINYTGRVDPDLQSPLQSIYDERDRALAEAESITDPTEKQKKTDEILKETQVKIESKITADEEKLHEQSTIIDYTSIEEAKANIPIEFPVPNYLPDGFVFEKIRYSKQNTDRYEMVKYYYKSANASDSSDYAQDYLIISYLPQDIHNYEGAPEPNQINVTEEFNQNTDIEEISVLNNPGYVLKEINSGKSKFFMSVNALCQNYRVGAGMSIHYSNIESDIENVKSELIKVLESFLPKQ